jgi:hypothetical protein
VESALAERVVNGLEIEYADAGGFLTGWEDESSPRCRNTARNRLIVKAIVTLGLRWPFANMAEGELRCESGGAVVVRIAGKDYAVNGMASARYPPTQSIGTTIIIPAPTSIA